MMKFAVYDKEGLSTDWPMVNPYLMGPEDVPVRGNVYFEDGFVVCEGPRDEASALSVQYETEAMGNLMLQTCLLPARKKPYVLSIELARHRIKMFISKSEEWQMFDLSTEHPAIKHWEEARRLFTEAITISDLRLADQAARYSLIHAIEASERLAMAHADVLIHRRFATRAASSTSLGVRIRPEAVSSKVLELIKSEFDLLILPMSWREIEPVEGKLNWEPYDRWMEWAEESGKPIIAGPLLDFSKRALPDWMNVWKHDFDACRDQAYDYIEKVVSRYKSNVSFWNVVSGINVNDNFEFTLEQMIDLTRMVSLHVRQARKGTRTMIELTQPFGEYKSKNRDSVAPLQFVDRIMQEGIKFDAIGLQMLFGRNEQGMNTRDLMQISTMLDKFFLLEVPVIISSFGAPSMTVDPRGGWWRHEWSDSMQAKWITQFFAMAMSKPFVESVFWTELIDHDDAPLPGSGLISTGGKIKPGFKRICEVRKRLRKPLGRIKLPRKTDDSP